LVNSNKTMKTDIFEKILTPVLEDYMNIDFDFKNKSLGIHNIQTKERVGTIRNMKILIYSNDHNPPHFHVISNDNSVNAKFTIDSCQLLSGNIENKDIKRIEAFHKDPKTIIVLTKIWTRRTHKTLANIQFSANGAFSNPHHFISIEL